MDMLILAALAAYYGLMTLASVFLTLVFSVGMVAPPVVKLYGRHNVTGRVLCLVFGLTTAHSTFATGPRALQAIKWMFA